MFYDSSEITAVPVSISSVPAVKRTMTELDSIRFSSISSKTPYKTIYNFVSIDVETTGLSPSKHEIVEVAAIRFRDGVPVEKFTSYAFPQRGISAEASEINGITLGMVSNAPAFSNIAKSFEDFLGDDNIVGHNLKFDLRFLCKYGVNFLAKKRRYYDTLQLAHKKLKSPKKLWDEDRNYCGLDWDSDYDVENYKLGTLCEYYDIEMFQTHRAADDCYAAGLLFIQLGMEYGAIDRPTPMTLEEALAQISAQPEPAASAPASPAPAHPITVRQPSAPEPPPSRNPIKRFFTSPWFLLCTFFLFLILVVLTTLAGWFVFAGIYLVLSVWMGVMTYKKFSASGPEE